MYIYREREREWTSGEAIHLIRRIRLFVRPPGIMIIYRRIYIYNLIIGGLIYTEREIDIKYEIYTLTAGSIT